MFTDELKLELFAGKGGDGAATFRREKFVAMGGPSGGDGGKGGDVIFQVNPHINTLSNLANRKVYRADNGVPGRKKNMHGANATPLILEVPMGTMIYNEDKTQLLADLKSAESSYMVVKGGKGGKGNARFASATNQAPRFAEKGAPGEEKIVNLELKLVADVGIIGLPSAGKSTLISVISNAKPKIAEYHFTTLVPNLGVVKMGKFGASDSQSFYVADIPGLIEGASEGKGLGHQFLRHIKRNNILIHVLDIRSKDPVEDYKTVRQELEKFDIQLAQKEEIIALNKIDSLPEDLLNEIKNDIESKLGKKTYPISAIAQIGLKDLVLEVSKTLEKVREEEKHIELLEIETEKIPVLQPHIKESQYEIDEVIEKETFKIFKISGRRIEELFQMTDVNHYEGLERVYHFLQRMGVKRHIERLGAQYGDKIQVLNYVIPYRR